MDRTQIETIIDGRLSLWKERLLEEHATPILVMGIGHDHGLGQVHFCVVEDLSESDCAEMLRGVVALLEQRAARRN